MKKNKLKMRLTRANGHRSEIDAELGERGLALYEMVVACLSGGEKVVPELSAAIDAFVARRAAEREQ